MNESQASQMEQAKPPLIKNTGSQPLEEKPPMNQNLENILTKERLSDSILAKSKEIQAKVGAAELSCEDFYVGKTDRFQLQAWLEGNVDAKYKLLLDPDGNLFCFGLPKFVHESAAGFIAAEVLEQLHDKGIRHSNLTIAPFPDIYRSRVETAGHEHFTSSEEMSFLAGRP